MQFHSEACSDDANLLVAKLKHPAPGLSDLDILRHLRQQIVTLSSPLHPASQPLSPTPTPYLPPEPQAQPLWTGTDPLSPTQEQSCQMDMDFDTGNKELAEDACLSLDDALLSVPLTPTVLTSSQVSAEQLSKDSCLQDTSNAGPLLRASFDAPERHTPSDTLDFTPLPGYSDHSEKDTESPDHRTPFADAIPPQSHSRLLPSSFDTGSPKSRSRSRSPLLQSHTSQGPHSGRRRHRSHSIEPWDGSRGTSDSGVALYDPSASAIDAEKAYDTNSSMPVSIEHHHNSQPLRPEDSLSPQQKRVPSTFSKSLLDPHDSKNIDETPRGSRRTGRASRSYRQDDNRPRRDIDSAPRALSNRSSRPLLDRINRRSLSLEHQRDRKSSDTYRPTPVVSGWECELSNPLASLHQPLDNGYQTKQKPLQDRLKPSSSFSERIGSRKRHPVSSPAPNSTPRRQGQQIPGKETPQGPPLGQRLGIRIDSSNKRRSPSLPPSFPTLAPSSAPPLPATATSAPETQIEQSCSLMSRIAPLVNS